MTGQPNLQTTKKPQPPTPVHKTTDLMNGGETAHIRLKGQTYSLRITRAGKLILTK